MGLYQKYGNKWSARDFKTKYQITSDFVGNWFRNEDHEVPSFETSKYRETWEYSHMGLYQKCRPTLKHF